jgi:hypothetical protein
MNRTFISNRQTLIYLFFSIIFVVPVFGQQLAFPGAEGYGRFVTGGRGGVVLEVTNLNDAGPGSLREAILAKGARTVVFRVSGTIKLASKLGIKNPNITIAGQTAPGDGICIRDYPVYIESGDHVGNVIMRYLRFRLGDSTDIAEDSFTAKRMSDIIIDHCTMSWAVDENCSPYNNTNFTMQWCLIYEGLYRSVHGKGDHSYGGIWGGIGATFHHNMFAHNTSRNPRFNGFRISHPPEPELVDFVNNVIYNWGFNSTYGGEMGNQNIRNNYFKYGPATNDDVKYRVVEPYDTTGNWYIDGNYIYGSPDVTADNWLGVDGDHAEYQKNKKMTVPFTIAPVSTQSAEECFPIVLENVGCNFPVRDIHDIRVIEEARTGTATYGGAWGDGLGIIDTQADVGSWPELHSLPAPEDEDHDGMADEWELANGLNPANAADRNNVGDDGYTMLEVYLNSLVSPVYSAIENKAAKPVKDYLFAENYPNPFNPDTWITFNLPQAGHVTLTVYDILGQQVATLLDEQRSQGRHTVLFKGSDYNTGMYIYRLSHNTQTISGKMLLAK